MNCVLRTADVVYLDSSALVKLVIREPESGDLADYLISWNQWASSALARTQVVRAVRPHGPEAVARARKILNDLYLLAVDNALLDEAGDLELANLRSLDAIHLASARRLGSDLDRLVTYDSRMAVAARAIAIPVGAPAIDNCPALERPGCA
jgi:predicted nucleic acid-binding protein